MSNESRFEAAGKLIDYQWNPPKALSHIEPGNVIEVAFEHHPDRIRAIVLDRAMQTSSEDGTQEFLLQLMIEEPDDGRISVTNFDARGSLWATPELRMRDPNSDEGIDWIGTLSDDPIVLADTPAEYEGVEEEFDRIRMGSETILDIYQRYVSQFAEMNDLDYTDIESQWLVVEEEIEEMEDAYDNWIKIWDHSRDPATHPDILSDLAEEMADAIYTIHLAAWMLDIDLREEFIEKASYNLGKSGERDENGKIIDDAGGDLDE